MAQAPANQPVDGAGGTARSTGGQVQGEQAAAKGREEVKDDKTCVTWYYSAVAPRLGDTEWADG